MNTLNNKDLVTGFYKRVLAQGDLAYAKKIIKEEYIQHSPNIKNGRSGVLAMLQHMAQLPKPKKPPKPFYRYICEGDMVAVHLGIDFMGQKRAVVDLFRIEDGQLAEHWDASEILPEPNTNPTPPVAGPTRIENVKMGGHNKMIVQEFTDKLVTQKEFDKSKIMNNMLEHTPFCNSSVSYFTTVKFEKVHRIIAEGNYVLTQAFAKVDTKAYAVFDIYRLEQSKIVEHWSVRQEIPEQMAHDNGMF
ncbi:MAG: hypothetical protein CL868_16125 [Cytophagaceae bacterium]|nr:hypothetical protein [Cytophagaceae bacterium]|tara:strand:+ start:1299 stop:2036 length:738 start_codon:yes stop_codon:yes gene_type:complete